MENPAVENPATDRAFRIGQRRNVQVRKFICTGTLEERIDQMMEQKKALADLVVPLADCLETFYELSAALPRRSVVQTPADSLLDQLPAVDVVLRGTRLVEALRPAYLVDRQP